MSTQDDDMVSNDEVDPADAVSSADVEVSDPTDPERDFFPGGLLDMVVSSMRGDILRRTLVFIRAYSDPMYMVRWYIRFKAQERETPA